MQLRFASVDEWLARAEERYACDLPTFSVKAGAGRVIDIKPFVALCRDVAVIGADWIPAYTDGLALLEQMVHTPGQYLDKAINIEGTDGGYRLLRPIERIDEDAVLVGGRDNYYHWLLDFLPRLILARNVVGARKLIVNHDLTKYELDSLRELGFAPDQLLPLAPERVIQPRTTIVPSLLSSTTVPHKALPGLLKAAFPQTASSGCERVYVSRADATRRGLSNEAELIALVERYGFKTFVTGRMSFEEQRNLFYGAKAVLAVNGAAMANIAFSAPDTHILDICWSDWKPTFIQLLARFCRQKHEYIPARVVAVGTDENPAHGTWEVDLAALAAVLQSRFG